MVGCDLSHLKSEHLDREVWVRLSQGAPFRTPPSKLTLFFNSLRVTVIHSLLGVYICPYSLCSGRPSIDCGHGFHCHFVAIIHPESHTVCNYYPNFLIIRVDGSTHLVEVKSAWKAGDPVVVAKQEAERQMAEGNLFHYALVTKVDFSAFSDSASGWHRYQRPIVLEQLALG